MLRLVICLTIILLSKISSCTQENDPITALSQVIGVKGISILQNNPRGFGEAVFINQQLFIQYLKQCDSMLLSIVRFLSLKYPPIISFVANEQINLSNDYYTLKMNKQDFTAYHQLFHISFANVENIWLDYCNSQIFKLNDPQNDPFQIEKFYRLIQLKLAGIETTPLFDNLFKQLFLNMEQNLLDIQRKDSRIKVRLKNLNENLSKVIEQIETESSNRNLTGIESFMFDPFKQLQSERTNYHLQFEHASNHFKDEIIFILTKFQEKNEQLLQFASNFR